MCNISSQLCTNDKAHICDGSGLLLVVMVSFVSRHQCQLQKLPKALPTASATSITPKYFDPPSPLGLDNLDYIEPLHLQVLPARRAAAANT